MYMCEVVVVLLPHTYTTGIPSLSLSLNKYKILFNLTLDFDVLFSFLSSSIQQMACVI